MIAVSNELYVRILHQDICISPMGSNESTAYRCKYGTLYYHLYYSLAIHVLYNSRCPACSRPICMCVFVYMYLRLVSTQVSACLIVSRRRKEGITVLTIIVGAIRVEAIEILGITITSDLTMYHRCPGDTQMSRPYRQGTPRSHKGNNYGPGHVCFFGLVGLY